MMTMNYLLMMTEARC